MGKKTDKVLIGREAIMSFLDIGKSVFYELVEKGLPVNKPGVKCKSYTAHIDELEEFFRTQREPV